MLHSSPQVQQRLDVVVRQTEKICARPTALPELEPRPPRLRIAGKQDAPFDPRDSKIGINHAIEKTVDHGVIEQHVVRRGNEQRITCFTLFHYIQYRAADLGTASNKDYAFVPRNPASVFM